MENTKQWWMSKTIWTNLIALVGSIVLALGMDSDRWAEIAAVSLALVNLALRLATKEPIELSTQRS